MLRSYPIGSRFVNVKFLFGLALLTGMVDPWILSHQPYRKMPFIYFNALIVPIEIFH